MSIKSLLNQTLTHYPTSSRNEFGETVSSSNTDYPCRFEPMTKRIPIGNGNVLTIDATVIVAGDMPAVTDDRVSFNSVDYKVVDRFPVPDDLGNTHHIELRLIKWPIST